MYTGIHFLTLDIAIYFTNSNYLIDNGHPSMNPGISLSNPASFIFTVRVLEEDHTAVGKT